MDMLDTIRNVAPPFACTNSDIHGSKPSSSNDTEGIILPPFRAKLTALKSPPITKKNKKIFAIERFIGLLISEGFTALSVIFMPYRNPMANAGANRMFRRSGDL